MNQSRFATSILRRIGFFLPLFLTLLVAADAAYACPQHSGSAGYRTKRIVQRSAYSPMATTVITYRAPISYRRCGNTLTDTRGARYVATRGDRHYAGSRRMVVRDRYDDYGYYQPRRSTRYVAVRDHDRYEAPRYVAVQRRAVRVERPTRYVAVLSGSREKLVPVSEIADVYDDDIQYVSARRHSGKRYVSVRSDDDFYRGKYVRYEAPRTRYIAVRNHNTGCARAVALRSCLGDAGTMSTRRVVLRSHDDIGYNTRTKYVAVRDEIEEDDDYERDEVDYTDDDVDHVDAAEVGGSEYVSDVDEVDHDVMPTRIVSSNDHIDNDDAYLTEREVESAYVRPVAVRTSPRTYRTETISYAPVRYYDDDYDDQAYLDGGGATYVADEDIGDACLKPVAYYEEPQYTSTMRTVSYVPADDVDDYAFHGGSAGTYVETRQPVSNVSYVAADHDAEHVDSEATYVAAEDDMDTVAQMPVDEIEHMDAEPVSYVADEDVDAMYVAQDEYCPMDTNMDVSYVEAEPVYAPVRRAKVRSVSFVPAKRAKVRSVSYVPVKSYQNVETTYVAGEEYCPMEVGYVEEAAEPVYVVERRPTVVVREVSSSYAALSPAALRIARTLGYHEGFEDGLDDLQDGDDFEPSDGGAQGYKREYGDKHAYRAAFREAYMEGYNAGFRSTAPAL